jgi:RNA polymerase sigma factor (sigma-70 family)
MTEKLAPYPPEELYAIAQSILAQWAKEGCEVPRRWREDVIAEGVAAAFEVTVTRKECNRRMQYKTMRGVMLDFIEREKTAERRMPRGSLPNAKRVPLDKIVYGEDEEATTLAETIIDRNCPDPSDDMVGEDRKCDVAQAMARLSPEEREAVQRVFIDGQTQEDAAAVMSVTRNELRAWLKSAKKTLRMWLSEYCDDVRCGTRRKKRR